MVNVTFCSRLNIIARYYIYLLGEKYYTLVTIPAGARSINVYEMNVSNSYIAVRTSSKKYHLNGYWTVDWPGKYKFAGTLFVYQRPYNHPETLSASGPTNESIIIEVSDIVMECCSLYQSQMVTKETCYKDFQVQVDASLCDPKSRPATGTIPCKMPACFPSWSVGNWSGCSLTCGGGERFRDVHCMQRIQYEPERVSDSLCQIPAPVTRELCNTQRCPPTWSTGPWSECSRTCGKGWRKRTILCKSFSSSRWNQILPDVACAAELKPKMQETCLLKRCYKNKKLQWFVSTWTEVRKLF
ncbi:A disintegrin and metalloproteinase with thrombospondin motifs 16-like [Ahaetulla prasina]|uniref:A disintegrin and metalloproteinase with thrombospondin motifs 16-like n=1 Tax=Ahaetulla prasina TaxID=499056 RepID=UPI002647FE99|nr:A disintegrin and metalloproteinase with thrombospondin motifs 16-like [Ahaetulla prasina]